MSKRKRKTPQEEYSPKDRSMAGNLGVVFGPIGAHRFYLGYPIHGIIQILLTLTIVGALWGIYEGITILWGNEWRDGQGRLLRPSPPTGNQAK